MFRIGEFSRISRVTIDTLRHYDALGLLKPAKVDSFIGFRYYSARKLAALNRIAALAGWLFVPWDVELSFQKLWQFVEIVAISLSLGLIMLIIN